MTPAPSSNPRPRAAGKFLFAGDDKLWIKGVTYGTFRPDAAHRRGLRVMVGLAWEQHIAFLLCDAAKAEDPQGRVTAGRPVPHRRAAGGLGAARCRHGRGGLARCRETGGGA